MTALVKRLSRVAWIRLPGATWGAFSQTLLAAAIVAIVLVGASETCLGANETRTLKGVALVIGETKYEHLADLDNPDNDAKGITKLLDSLGFDAHALIDRNSEKLKRDFDRFVEDARGTDVALVYYSGHAIEAGGENWLVPIDADLSSLTQAGKHLVSLSPYLQELQRTVPLTIVLLDACRSNPFPRGASLRALSSDLPIPLAMGGLSVPAKGVIVLNATETVDEIREIVLGFAAAPGHLALDGPKDGNSPYAAALLKHLSAKGLDFGDVLTLVSQEVYVETQGRQIPWTNHNLRQFLYFGTTGETDKGDEAQILGERRRLLLTIASTPADKKRLVETIARNDHVPLDALYGMLNMLEIDGLKDPDDLNRQLRAGSEKLKSFLAERQTLKSPDHELTRLSRLADEAVGEGAIRAAISFREKAKARIAILSAAVDQTKRDVKARELEFARAFAASAQTNILAFDYLTAAHDYKAAYEKAETWDRKLAFTFKLLQAGALSEHGDYKGDNSALEGAIDAYGEAIALSPQKTNPDDWAMTQNNLGNALRRLGDRESGTARLEAAVVAYQAALGVNTRKRTPLNWARIQANLGTVLSTLGERESGTARLEQAIVAIRAALEEMTRERLPLDWAKAQTKLGNALSKLGERESGTARLEESVVAYRAALEEWAREKVPLEWATIQNNLGVVLTTLGKRESGKARFEEAIVAFRAALQERIRERVPLYWANTQYNLGNALRKLGEHESGTARLEEAVVAYRAALEEMTRERVPIGWANVQHNLGNALKMLGDREGRTAPLEEAVVAYRAALQEMTREKVPFKWATAHHNLGTALLMLGVRTGSIKLVEEAKRIMQSSKHFYESERIDEYEDYFTSKLAEIDTELAKLKGTIDSSR